MSLSSEILRKLASLNLSQEQMCGVLGILADNIEKEEERKLKQAERKRLSRDSHKNVTSMSRDTPPNGSNGFPHPSLNSFTPTKENPPKGGQKKNTPPEIPSWMPLDAWSGFVEMRTKIKKPMTHRAQVLAIGKLEKFMAQGHDPTEILNQSTFNDYQDLYEPKENKNGNYSIHKPNKDERAKAAVARGVQAYRDSLNAR